jgi:DNA-binding NarL/FixJ family response regulator
MTRLLIAHHDVDMVDLIQEELLAGLPNAALNISYCKNRQRALELISAHAPDLLIAYIDLAEDRTSSRMEKNGLELVRALRNNGMNLPCVLLAPSASRDLSSAVYAIDGARLVLEGSSFSADLLQHVQAALEASTPPATNAGQKRRARQAVEADSIDFVIDMRLRRDGNCNYTSWSRGGRAPFRNEKKFSVEPAALQDLIKRSQDLAVSETWQGEYRALGELLRDVLIRGNLDVNEDIGFARGMMFSQNRNSIPSIRFIVESGIHLIAFEAIVDNQGDYWMQRAAVWRQLDLRIGQFPLYQDEGTRAGPINTLIIEANAEGRVAALGLDFPLLAGVSEEADWLENLLRTQAGRRIGKIGRIRRDAESGEIVTSVSNRTGTPKLARSKDTFPAILRKMLEDGEPWHIVHYAGHSHYDAKSDSGFVILPGQPPDPLSTTEISSWLSRSRFVYMSSCLGSSQDFVFNLCKSNVPAVAGFRWNVDDGMAREHSRTFYQELLARRSLEGAFVETWKQMYGKYKMDRVWAAPELIVQLAA